MQIKTILKFTCVALATYGYSAKSEVYLTAHTGFTQTLDTKWSNGMTFKGAKTISYGGSIGYDFESFGVNLDYDRFSVVQQGAVLNKQVVTINPYFKYNISDNLKLKLGVGIGASIGDITFTGIKYDSTKTAGGVRWIENYTMLYRYVSDYDSAVASCSDATLNKNSANLANHHWFECTMTSTSTQREISIREKKSESYKYTNGTRCTTDGGFTYKLCVLTGYRESATYEEAKYTKNITVPDPVITPTPDPVPAPPVVTPTPDPVPPTTSTPSVVVEHQDNKVYVDDPALAITPFIGLEYTGGNVSLGLSGRMIYELTDTGYYNGDSVLWQKGGILGYQINGTLGFSF